MHQLACCSICTSENYFSYNEQRETLSDGRNTYVWQYKQTFLTVLTPSCYNLEAWYPTSRKGDKRKILVLERQSDASIRSLCTSAIFALSKIFHFPKVESSQLELWRWGALPVLLALEPELLLTSLV
jgi:hypothetical protein